MNSFVVFKNKWQKDPFGSIFVFSIRYKNNFNCSYNFFKINYILGISKSFLSKNNTNFIIKKNMLNLNKYSNATFFIVVFSFCLHFFYFKNVLSLYFNTFVSQLSSHFLIKTAPCSFRNRLQYLKNDSHDLLEFNLYLL